MDQREDYDTDTEIDPQWFIKCRLCINEMGVYQILPSVQEQIFYCFQIQVKAFDSLPQLICKKCKFKLIEFYDVKKTFVDNQAKISSQLDSMKKKENQKEVASLKTEDVKEIVEHKKEEKSQKISDSIKRNSYSTEAEQNFNKIYVCRYCGMKYKKHIEIIKHIINHKKLLTKSKKYISKHLVISLDKFDSKPNFTGHHRSVALGSDNVNLDEGSPHYFIKLEQCKVISNDNKPVKTPEKKAKRKQVFLDSDSSDSRSQLVFQSQPQKKRRKIVSNGSSTETIIIDDDAKSIQSEKSTEGLNSGIVNEELNDACINIDDSSSDTLYAGGVRNKDKKKSEEMAAIESIISMCYKKYTSNTVSQGKNVTKSDLDKMLNRKFLSIGRKILLGKSIPCQGLLKYLEHKNITIHWSANTLMNSKNSQVRINTNVVDIKNSNNLEGWIAIKENEQLDNHVVDLPNPIKTFSREDTPYASNFFDDPPLEEDSNVCPIEDLNCATLMLQSFDTESTGSKLLNENPVANPKQLPKSLNRLLFDIKVKKNDVHVHNGAANDLGSEEGNRSDLSMPVIVSSESLASAVIIDPQSRTKQEDTKENTNCLESITSLNASVSSRPRLKCKPVSELMSNTTEHSSLLSAPIIKPVESGLRNATIVRLEHRSSSITGNITSSLYHTKNNNNFVCVQPVKSTPEGPGFKLIPPGQRETPVPKPPKVLWTNPPTQDLAGTVLLHSKPLSMGSATGSKGIVPVTSESGPQAATSAAPATTSPADAASTPAAVAAAPTATSADNAATEVVMNSVHLPNMPVQNSIKYFQSVLLLHNLELMTGTKSDITSEFTCLIKFKLEIRLQGRSVVLSVFVFAKTGCFCIKLKKPNLDEIDIDALPPHWQVHILKAFKGQVSEKIINCASKVSRDLHGDAKLFVYLLNSIEYNK